jgi:SAC3 family protein LENG8/THP3
MVEYNQCQATLKTLYELGIEGRVEEFTAYRILMLLHGRNRSGKYRPASNFWFSYYVQ